MSLNKKQWTGVVVVLCGLLTLPVVSAMTEDQDSINELIRQQQQTNHQDSVQPPLNSIVSTTGDKTTVPAYNNVHTLTNYQGNETLDAARSSSQSYRDEAGQANCQYSPEAYRVGVKHYRFADASKSDLVNIGGGHKLHREAAAALRQLQAAARADGVTLTVGSAFRSSQYQQGIVKRKKAAKQTDKQIYTMSSAPGFSEHHTGYTLDFSPINNSFAKTKAYAWLRQNAEQYGWYQSFTPDSVRNTHVAVESWHWKYKGSPNAQAALANDSCYSQPF